MQRRTCTVDEAAEILGLGRSRIYEMCAENTLRRLPGSGRRVVVIVSSIAELLGLPPDTDLFADPDQPKSA